METKLTHFLTLPIFWKEYMIARFWCELSEILNQVGARIGKNRNQTFNEGTLDYDLKSAIENINTKENLTLICGDSVNDWMEKVGKAIKEYVELRNKYADPKHKDNYNGQFVTDLLRLYRNLSTHKYSNYVYNFSQFSKQETSLYNNLNKQVKAIFKDGGVQNMLRYFPELLLISYSLGYAVNKCLKKHKIDSNFGDFYYQNMKFDETDPYIPHNLLSFSSKLLDETSTQENKATEVWSQLVTFENGPTVQLFRRFDDNIMNLGQREMLVLYWDTLDGKVRSCELSWDKISYREEYIEFEKSGNKKDVSLKFYKPDVLNFRSNNLLNTNAEHGNNVNMLPTYIFTDVLAHALGRCFSDSQSQHFVIFTHLPIKEIQKQVERFSLTTDKKYSCHALKWDDLEGICANRLLEKNLVVHKGSTIKFQLLEQYDRNKSFVKDIGANILLELLQDSRQHVIETQLPELQQDEYITRILLDGQSSIREDDFVENLNTFRKSQNKLQNVFLITGISGMGKSTLLAKLGYRFVEKGHVVRHVSAKSLTKQVCNTSDSTTKNIVAELSRVWSSFETYILIYLLNKKEKKGKIEQKIILSLLVDALDEVETDLDNVLDYFARLKSCLLQKGFNFNFIFTATPNIEIAKSYKEKLGLSKNYNIEGFEYSDKKDFLLKRWKSPSSNTESTISDNIDQCITDSLKLGEFGGAAYAMVLYASVYRSSERIGENNLKPTFQLHHAFVDLLMEESFLSSIQACDGSSHSTISRHNLNTRSPELSVVKKTLTWINARNAFEMTFPDAWKLLQCFDLTMSMSKSKFLNITETVTKARSLVYGSLKEFYIAIFVCDLLKTQAEQKEIQWPESMSKFFTEHLLSIDENKECLNYASLLCLINSVLESEEYTFFSTFSVPQNFDTVMLYLARNRWRFLFLSLLKCTDAVFSALADCWNVLCANTDEENYAYDLFHFAIEENNLRAVKYCIFAMGLNVNACHHETEQTALHWALVSPNNGRHEIIECLLDSQADMSATNFEDLSAFEIACASESITADTFQLFAKYGNKEQFQQNAENWRKAVVNGVYSSMLPEFQALFKTDETK